MESTIKLIVCYEGQTYFLETSKHEYRDLMSLLKDKICPEDFGQCGGMGRCGTCLIGISGMPGDSGMLHRNEHQTLRKFGIKDPEIRLSCQIQVNEDLENLVVQLLNNI